VHLLLKQRERAGTQRLRERTVPIAVLTGQRWLVSCSHDADTNVSDDQ
jgi:hypothetical protein